MNTLGHSFFRKVNNNQFDELDKLHPASWSGYFFCKICGIEIYHNRFSKKLYYEYTTLLNMNCNQFIIKKLLE